MRNKSLKIVHLASGDLWAGAEVQLLNLVLGLQKIEHIEINVILLNPGLLSEKLIENNIKTIVLDESQLNSIQIFFHLTQALKVITPDIIHTHRQKENILGSFAGLFIPKSHSIRTVHGANEHPPKFWQVNKTLIHLLDWFCGRFIQSKIIVVSSELKNKLSKKFPTSRLSIIENGIDISLVKQFAANNTNLPGSESNIKIAFIGRLSPVKRPDIFIDIAKNLLTENSGKYDFYIIGDGPLKNECFNTIKNNGLKANVFMIGFKKDLPAYLSKMNLLYMTSDHEGLPMILLEAMTLKIPIVSHAVGGIPNILNEGEYGTLIKNQNLKPYVDAAQQYIKNPVPFKSKADKAFKNLLKNYTAEINAKKIHDLYYSVARVNKD